VQNFDASGEARNFQGQLSYDNTAGHTEVEQAVRILRALNRDLLRIQITIGMLANAVAAQLPSRSAELYTDTNNNGQYDFGEPYTDTNNNGQYDPDEPYTDTNNNGRYDPGEPFVDSNGNRVYDAYLPEAYKRNEIVYAWKDKFKSSSAEQFSHLVKVKIDGYPENLPNVTESAAWGWATGLLPERCRQLNDYQGQFTISTWRYDQDQPTDITEWQLRRRKQPNQPEIEKAKLGAMVEDVQKCGILNNPCVLPLQNCIFSDVYTDMDVDELLNDYAIKSTSQAHYGPAKSDIYINSVSQ